MTTSGSHKQPSIHLPGFPNAVKLVDIRTPKAKRLADLALHQEDLRFALECLGLITINVSESNLIQKALWRSALVSFFKCFGNGDRFQLSPQKLLKGEPSEAMKSFNYFKSLRNKHVVHDENSYTQTVCGAVLNPEFSETKVDRVIALCMDMHLDQTHLSSFITLVKFILDSVSKEFDALELSIRGELESESYSTLISLPAPIYHAPMADEVHVHKRPGTA